MAKYSKAEIEILENYWARLNEFESTLSGTTAAEQKSPKYKRMKLIVTELKALFPTLDADLQKIIEMRYLDDAEMFEWSEVADELYYSVAKTLRKRTVILNKTCEAIGWV